MSGAALSKRKHAAVEADNGRPRSGQNPRVRFQEEERPEKCRLVIPEDFTPVQQSCVVDPGAVASGRQELWLIQLPNLAALQNLAATGSIEVDSSILRSSAAAVAPLSASIGSLPSFQCHDGLSYKLVPEVTGVAKQLVTICPMQDEEGAAQALSVSRRLTLVLDLPTPEVGSTAGEPEDVEAALARLDASLAAMGAARREAAALDAVEDAMVAPMEVDYGRADVDASAAAGGVSGSGGEKPNVNDLPKEERSDKRKGKEGEGAEATHKKEKHKEKSKEKDKKKDKDKDKHGKSKLAQTPGVVPAIRGTEMKQPPATAPPAMRPPTAAETPATAAVEAPPAGAASIGKENGKHKDKKHKKHKDKKDKDKKHKDKDKKKKDKKEKAKDKETKKESSSETESDSD